MTPTEQIERLRQLEKAATPGPWKWLNLSGKPGKDEPVYGEKAARPPLLMCYGYPHYADFHQDANANAALIAAARNLLPAFLDIAEAAMWLTADDDNLADIDKGFAKLTAALSRLGGGQ